MAERAKHLFGFTGRSGTWAAAFLLLVLVAACGQTDVAAPDEDVEETPEPEEDAEEEEEEPEPEPELVVVPDVVGMGYAEARQTISVARLRASLQHVDQEGEGVVDVDPAPGSEVEAGPA